MVELTMPSKEQFYQYTGEHISGKLAGDMKNQEDLLNILFKRSYRTIYMKMPGIRVEDLSDEDLANWHILIMEQAEYFLSVGDKSLSEGSKASLSPNVPELASSFGLWNAYYYVNIK